MAIHSNTSDYQGELMFLETLKGVKEIGGFKISHWPVDVDNEVIEIDDNDNSITFMFQKDPIKDNEPNGCHPGILIEAAWLMITGEGYNTEDSIECSAALMRAMQNYYKVRCARGEGK